MAPRSSFVVPASTPLTEAQQAAHAQDVSVTVARDGRVTVEASPEFFARLAGREFFGSVAPAQNVLRDAVAEAWYRAGCPKS